MRIVILLVALLCTFNGYSQFSPEEIYKRYEAAKSPNEQTEVLNKAFDEMAVGAGSERIWKANQLRDYFNRKGDLWGTGYIELAIALSYRVTGQYSEALKYSLPALKKFETLNDTFAIISALIQTGSSFTESQNMQQGLNYYKKCKTITEAFRDKESYINVLNKVADCYNKLNKPDSAMATIRHAMHVAEGQKDTINLVDYYAHFGESWLVKKEPDSAKIYLLNSFQFANNRKVSNKDSHTTNEYYANIYNDLAENNFQYLNYNEAINQARNAISYADPEYKSHLMIAYKWIYRSFEKLSERDSVNKYYRKSMDIKDLLFTSEKNSTIVLMDFQEQSRQQEIADLKIKEAKERRQNLEYALIALAITLSISFFLLLTNRFIIHVMIIQAFGVMTLLIVFEFINLLLDPFIARMTDESPAYMLLVLVIIAGCLAPIHHHIEKWATGYLIRKNKKIVNK